MPEARVPSAAELDWLTRRAVAEIIPHDDFVKAIKSGKALRLKMGFDPSAPDLTIGHAVGLRKLRQLQELGHTVVIIVGDWTAQIGDPSGQSKTRPMLTADQVNANAETYLRQFFKIVDREKTEVFAERYQRQQPIGVHELLYPLLQGYDSVAVEADVEFGGTDQKFNLLVGRELQVAAGQKAQSVFTVPLLVGTDGEVKMGKSVGNYVAVDDAPNEMYGKLMSIPDHLIGDYFEYLTDVPDKDVAAVREMVEKRTGNPMDAKKRLAHELVTQFHDATAADGAQEFFERTFSKRELPKDVPEKSLSFDAITDGGTVRLPKLLVELGLTKSTSEGSRLFKQGAVEVDGEVAKELRITPRDGMIIHVGKHRFVRLLNADA